jgi:hypothetical protein
MKIQIDLKSALCGLLAGVAVMFCIGAASSPFPAGKYQIAGAADPNGTFFAVMDTQTGEVWGMNSGKDWIGDKAGAFWQPK